MLRLLPRGAGLSRFLGGRRILILWCTPAACRVEIRLDTCRAKTPDMRRTPKATREARQPSEAACGAIEQTEIIRLSLECQPEGRAPVSKTVRRQVTPPPFVPNVPWTGIYKRRQPRISAGTSGSGAIFKKIHYPDFRCRLITESSRRNAKPMMRRLCRVQYASRNRRSGRVVNCL